MEKKKLDYKFFKIVIIVLVSGLDRIPHNFVPNLTWKSNIKTNFKDLNN
jgi:hypothetical protein